MTPSFRAVNIDCNFDYAFEREQLAAAGVELVERKSATEDEIIEHCRAMLARFKAPKRVVFGPLPKTSTGKIQKFVLRERAKSTSAIE